MVSPSFLFVFNVGLITYISSLPLTLLLRKVYIYYTGAPTWRNAFASDSFLWVIPFWNANTTANGDTLKIHYPFIPRFDEFIKSFPVGYLGKAAPYVWYGKDLFGVGTAGEK